MAQTLQQKMQMNQYEIAYLQKLRKACQARLRELELQAAKYGIDCPAHIRVEINDTKEQMINFEDQIRSGSTNFDFEDQIRSGSTNSDASRIEPRKVNGGIIVAIITAVALITWIIIQTSRTSNPRPVPTNPPSAANASSSAMSSVSSPPVPAPSVAPDQPASSSLSTNAGPSIVTSVPSSSPTAPMTTEPATDTPTIDPIANVTTVAGPQISATDTLSGTDGVTLSRDKQFALFADYYNHVIRRLDLKNGQVTILAGSIKNPGSKDGIGEAARFSNPSDVALSRDGSFALVADFNNHTIRKVDIKTREVTTLAGSGQAGSKDGRGAAAEFNNPMSVALSSDGTFALVADYGNDTIRRLEITGDNSGDVSTLAGKAGEKANKDGIGAEARFASPSSVALSAGGDIAVVASLDHSIRTVEVGTAKVTTIAGKRSDPGNADGREQQARFYNPFGVALSDDGTFALVADTFNHTLRKVVIATGDVTTLAGKAGEAGKVDGSGTDARFHYPNSVALSADGCIALVSDSGTSTIRRIALMDQPQCNRN